MLDGATREAVRKRLNRIAGQVQGLQRMVDGERYCIEVLQQIAAVEAALHKVGGIILKNHLETCVHDAYECRDGRDQRRKIQELIQVFESMRPK